MNGSGRGNGQADGPASGGTPGRNGYPAADRSAGYPDPAFRNGQHGGYGQPGYPPANYDQRGHGTPDRGYGQDGYYPGYGGGAR